MAILKDLLVTGAARFLNKIHGDLEGTASRATNDVDGNPIKTTYYKATNPNGYTSNTGTVTSVAVKMNGTTKGTITSSGTIDLGDITVPFLGQQDYTNFLASGDSDPAGYYYFGQIKPDSLYTQWHIKFRVHMEVPYNASVANSQHMSYEGTCEFNGYANNITSYENFNSHNSTSYRTFYHYNIYRAKTAGVLTYGHLMGFRFQSAYNPTTVNYGRNIHIELLEAKGCTFSFFDTMKLYANCPGTGSTNYEGKGDYDGANNGLRETGDDNTYDRLYYANNYMKTSDSIATMGSSLFGLSKNNEVVPISETYNGSSQLANTTNILLQSYSKAANVRVYNGEEGLFDWTKGLFYKSGSGIVQKVSDFNDHVFTAITGIDLRYTDNCVPLGTGTTTTQPLGLAPRKMVYLRGSIDRDGCFMLEPMKVTYNGQNYPRCWTQDIPTTEDGYVYWLVGMPYYNSSYPMNGYQVNLFENNDLYWFHNGEFQKYHPDIYTSDLINDAGYIQSGNDIWVDKNTTGSISNIGAKNTNGSIYFFSTGDSASAGRSKGIGTVNKSGVYKGLLSISNDNDDVYLTGNVKTYENFNIYQGNAFSGTPLTLNINADHGGITCPQYLDLYSTIRGIVRARKSGTEWADVQGKSFNNPSSMRYKKNIKDMSQEEGLNILKLRPVNYDYKVEGNGTDCSGFIAEEVSEVMKYPVVYIDGEIEGLDYSKFVPSIVKLCQIQQQQIDELQRKIESLERRLDQ